MEQVKNVLKDAVIQSVESKDTCKAYIEGKQHRKPFPHSDRKSSYAGELVNADLSSKLDKFVGGSRYFVLIKDDYSHYRTVYFLQEKSDTIDKPKHFIKFCKTYTGNSVKTIRTDNGTEFVNRETAKLFEEEGIIHEKSVSYTSE
jgi:Integrase core domain.